MDVNELRRAHAVRPFRPFYLHLADGRQILVRHPELLAISSRGLSAAVDTREGFEILDLAMVTSLEFRRRRRTA